MLGGNDLLTLSTSVGMITIMFLPAMIVKVWTKKGRRVVPSLPSISVVYAKKQNLVCVIAVKSHPACVKGIDVGSSDIAIASTRTVEVTQIVGEDSNYVRWGTGRHPSQNWQEKN